MEDFYRWQIEQLRATVAQQEQIINQLINDKLKYTTEKGFSPLHN